MTTAVTRLDNNANMLDILNTLNELNNQQASLNNKLYTLLQDQNLEVTNDMTLSELIEATEEGFSNINTESSDKDAEIESLTAQLVSLNSQITDLNNQLAGKVTPAGTAVAGDVLSGKTFINSTGQTITGTMTNRGGAKTITPSTSNQTIYSGYYSGNITVSGDSDLKAANIKSGVNIFGVTGTYVGGQTVSAGTSKIIAIAGQANNLRSISMDTYSYYEIFSWTSYVSGTVTIKVYGRVNSSGPYLYFVKNNSHESEKSISTSTTAYSYNMSVAVGDVVSIQIYNGSSSRSYYDGYVQISIA